MKRWVILAALLLLANCGGLPRVIPTSSNSHSIEFLVQSAKFVPLQDVEDRAQRHCANYGLASRRTQAEWVSESAMTFHFDCEDPHKPAAQKLADKKATEPLVVPPKAPAVSDQAELKQAAWSQANAMSPRWFKCIFDGATRMARASSESADIVAIAVAEGCSQWEHDIHVVLQRAGEDDGDFQADLHKQIIEFATARIVTVRTGPLQGSAPASRGGKSEHGAAG
jgi:hypothetical protein